MTDSNGYSNIMSSAHLCTRSTLPACHFVLYIPCRLPLLRSKVRDAGRIVKHALPLVQMVNEQIGTENMKRRVDLEARRQRKMAKVQKAMWADHAECLRMGYDWTARRAKWESELKELQSMREDHSAPQLAPIQTPRPRGRSSPNSRAMLCNDEVYQQALSKLDALEEDALPDVDLESDEEAPAAVVDWFKVGPSLLSGLTHTCSSILTAAHSWPV